MGIMYLDFNEAFDKVSHYVLVDKIEACGLDDVIVR